MGQANRTAAFAHARGQLLAAAYRCAAGEAASASARTILQGRLALRPGAVDLAADAVARAATRSLLSRGWRPAELHQFGAKRLDPLATSYLRDCLAGASQFVSDRSWRAELAALGASPWWTPDKAHLTQWAAIHGCRRAETVAVVVDVLALLEFLPRTQDRRLDSPIGRELLPGTLVPDERIAAKITALLVRAASSDYPSEAAACAAKARELVGRYATVPSEPEARAGGTPRWTLQDPRATARALRAQVRAGFTTGRAVAGEPLRYAAAFEDELEHLAGALVEQAMRTLPARRLRSGRPYLPAAG
ncbi:MAG: DUF2786 domain-containing protein [Jatrophihabitantaceae bacterium]